MFKGFETFSTLKEQVKLFIQFKKGVRYRGYKDTNVTSLFNISISTASPSMNLYICDDVHTFMNGSILSHAHFVDSI